MEFFIRTGKIGFWWLLPIVLISNTGTSDNRLLAETFVEDGRYYITAGEISGGKISGSAVFNKTTLFRGQRKKFSRIEIDLDPSGNAIGYSMGLVLFKQLDGSENPVGYYNVSEKTLGFFPGGRRGLWFR